MSIRSKVASALIAGLSLTPIAALSTAAAAPASRQSCFLITEWQGWKAPAPDVLYLGVRQHDIYRVQLSGPSPMIQSPGVHLVSINRGTSSICNALDLDLKVSDGHGFAEPLIARSITKLTPEEVAAVPPKFRP